jgi:hypothetical protein
MTAEDAAGEDVAAEEGAGQAAPAGQVSADLTKQKKKEKQEPAGSIPAAAPAKDIPPPANAAAVYVTDDVAGQEHPEPPSTPPVKPSKTEIQKALAGLKAAMAKCAEGSGEELIVKIIVVFRGADGKAVDIEGFIAPPGKTACVRSAVFETALPPFATEVISVPFAYSSGKGKSPETGGKPVKPEAEPPEEEGENPYQ